MKNLLLALSLVSGVAYAQSNIIAINPPNSGDVDYVNKIKNSFTAVDNHDHSNGLGLPVSRVGALVVGTSELATGGVTNAKLGAGAVTTAKIADGAVTTATIADGAVTQGKLGTANYQISSSSGTFSTASGTNVDVTNLTVTITTTGRPVRLMLVADGAVSSSFLAIKATNGNVSAQIIFLRDASAISQTTYSSDELSLTLDPDKSIPGSAFGHFDPVAAGTYTYKVQTNVGTFGTSPTVRFTRLKLVAYEL